jgi:hypothetical protein
MRTRFLWVAAVALGAAGCHRGAPVPELTPEAAAPLLASGQVRAVDVNNERFRRENGTIPGAVLLKDMGPEGLPEDRAASLVFYCTNRL